MTWYRVEIPLEGLEVFEVEAESAEAARRKVEEGGGRRVPIVLDIDTDGEGRRWDKASIFEMLFGKPCKIAEKKSRAATREDAESACKEAEIMTLQALVDELERQRDAAELRRLADEIDKIIAANAARDAAPPPESPPSHSPCPRLSSCVGTTHHRRKTDEDRDAQGTPAGRLQCRNANLHLPWRDD